jgi:hypothetical protein
MCRMCTPHTADHSMLLSSASLAQMASCSAPNQRHLLRQYQHQRPHALALLVPTATCTLQELCGLPDAISAASHLPSLLHHTCHACTTPTRFRFGVALPNGPFVGSPNGPCSV